jgi:hypothetical protein
MTARATFGDLAAAISGQLGLLPRPPLTATPGRRPDSDLPETARAVRTVIRPMARYVDDAITALGTVPWRQRGAHAPWTRAASRAREALASADSVLAAQSGEISPALGQAPGVLVAAAAAMTAARDLLQTHTATRPDGTPEPRSEWAPAVASVPVARAVLHEVAGWASQLAPHCAQAATSRMAGTHEERRALNAASQWLWALAWAVEAAHEQLPVAGTDLDLLHAIPAKGPAPRRLPSGRETVTGLCDGIVTAAERTPSPMPAGTGTSTSPLAPGPASESFRHIAGNCAVTSSNCHLVLQALATRTDLPPHLRARFRKAAEAAGQARAAWLRAAAEWDTITTSIRSGRSPAAADAEDLALWTGLLAYADPHWTPAAGPAATTRSPQNLAAGPAELRRVVAAMHHACHALSQAAARTQEQAQDAATTKQLVIPARNLIDSSGGRYLFAFAAPADATPLLSAYQDAETTSRHARAAIRALAAAVRAPARTLAATPASTATRRPARTAGPATRHRQPNTAPGPAQRILLDLGITHSADLELAADLDKATSHLILRAARTARPAARHSPALSASPGTAELISTLLATSEGNTAFNHPEPAAGPRDQTTRTARVLLHTQLPGDSTAPGQARQHVRQALADNGLASLTASAELLTSQLVASAADHTRGTTIGLTLSETTTPTGRPAITCEISGHSPQHTGPAGEQRPSPQTLRTLATGSGIRTSPDDRTRWFTLTAPALPARSTQRQTELEAGA